LRFNRPIGILITAARVDFPADGTRVSVQSSGNIAERTFLREHPADIFPLQIAQSFVIYHSHPT